MNPDEQNITGGPLFNAMFGALSEQAQIIESARQTARMYKTFREEGLEKDEALSLIGAIIGAAKKEDE